MSILQKARQYEESHIDDIDSKPEFHVSPVIGWLNDPNGFSLYQEEVHLFYQYHPYDTEWGPMHWGHYKTDDFIKWEYLPIAIAPDEEYDLIGCFSGSAIEHDGKHVLFYTGVTESESSNNGSEILQNQCIAIGDGIDYQKPKENPIIDGELLPEGFSNIDFRDPKVWKEDDVFHMVVANRNNDGKGQILLFQSDTLMNWKFTTVLMEYKKQFGNMWECPDFFKLDSKHILIISPQDMMARDLEYHNGNNVVYFLGEYNKEQHVFEDETSYAVDYGLDFYAPQTMQAADGRRILIGWMQSWDTKLKGADHNWVGMMTIPRELKLINNRLIQTPVREIEQYRHNKVNYVDYEIKGHTYVEGISGRTIDMMIDLLNGEYSTFDISFAQNEDYRVYCSYNKKDNILKFDRKYSGLHRDIICEREVKLASNTLKNIRVLLDKYSAEIFINDGEQVLSSLYFTPLEAKDIQFYCDGSVNINIEKFDIIVHR